MSHSDAVYKKASDRLRREHLTRLVDLAVCAGLYRKHNDSQLAQSSALDADIVRLGRRWEMRSGKDRAA